MSTATAPSAARMREGAICRNLLAKIGIPDTSPDPQGHSLGYFGSGGTFHILHLTPCCGRAPVLPNSFFSQRSTTELFIQVCVSNRQQ